MTGVSEKVTKSVKKLQSMEVTGVLAKVTERMKKKLLAVVVTGVSEQWLRSVVGKASVDVT